MEPNNVIFSWYLWKIFFSISHFLCSQLRCKLKQQHVGTSTFQHCQIFVSSFFGRNKKIKELWNFLPALYILFYYQIFYSCKNGLRIHPLSQPRCRPRLCTGNLISSIILWSLFKLGDQFLIFRGRKSTQEIPHRFSRKKIVNILYLFLGL